MLITSQRIGPLAQSPFHWSSVTAEKRSIAATAGQTSVAAAQNITEGASAWPIAGIGAKKQGKHSRTGGHGPLFFRHCWRNHLPKAAARRAQSIGPQGAGPRTADRGPLLQHNDQKSQRAGHQPEAQGPRTSILAPRTAVYAPNQPPLTPESNECS